MKLNPILENYRFATGPYASKPGARDGAFKIPNGPCGRALVIIASDGRDKREPEQLLGWEHVSVSTAKHIPTWVEMDFVKRLFWDDEECVVQFHPPRSQWVNNHPNVLHLWRWAQGEFPLPPSLLVGVKEVGEFKSPADKDRAQAIADKQVEEMRK